ncbi:ATP-binding protein, partial [Methylobacterium trifolii]
MSRADSDPLRSALDSWLAPDAGADVVLLAVSGGPDSTALMHAAAAYGRRDALHVATVDHGLRTDSTAEAATVGRAAE